MFMILKRMINSEKYTKEYLEERMNVLYLVNRLTSEEYESLVQLLDEKYNK